jgi:putative membrane protein
MMHGFGFGWGGFLGMILVWVLLIAGSVWLVKALFSGGKSNQAADFVGDEKAVDILDRRYARGEISREEYEIMKKDLLGS